MYRIRVANFTAWRAQARTLLQAGIPPRQVLWQDGTLPDEQTSMLEAMLTQHSHPLEVLPTTTLNAQPSTAVQVPKSLLPFMENVACYRDPERWSLLYQFVWRVTHGERDLLANQIDPLVRQLQLMMQAVGRDIHKMHAFVRFRKVVMDDDEGVPQDTYLAFHRPDHLVLHAAVPFFVKRFRVQRWGILTPDGSASWDGNTLVFGEGMPATSAPQVDDMEKLWLTYYRSIFNPARIKTRMMKREMPVHHWATLPESSIIRDMLAEAPGRVEEMLKYAGPPSEKAQRRSARVAASFLRKA